MKRAAAALTAAALLTGASKAPAPVDMAVVLAEAPAQTLAEYRLFIDAQARRPNARVTAYSLSTPLFSDYAEKFRYAYIPPGRKARTTDGLMDLPVGTVLVKTFAYPDDLRSRMRRPRYLETRLLIHKASGWVALPYVWSADQLQAVLKRAGTRIDVAFIDGAGTERQVDYKVPNTNQCKECHSASGELVPIGVKARNLPAAELAHWRRLRLLKGPEPAIRTARWDDPTAPLEARGRAYLDANCAHCHNPTGMASNSGLYLQLEETRPDQLGVGKRPVAAGRGSGTLEVAIDPGHPERSILVFRMASTDPGVMMPELGRSLVHEEGLALVRAFIAEMKP